MNQLLNEKEVAKALNVSVSTVRRDRYKDRKGLVPELKYSKIGSCVRYKPEDVQKFIEQKQAA
tara:strand:- start:13 stop:201 length:189 start_codon:yes stop_codon:yes gene_type:complete